jgi:G3E family GTPase
MHDLNQVPVVILNGFLGSGKTTLFRNLLNQSKKKELAIFAIVNDMSELDVDGEVLAKSSIIEEDETILNSISSCVISSKKGIEKLDEIINNILTNKYPDLIIIETSGSCHPMPLIKYFKEHIKAKLSVVLVLIDSLMMAHDFEHGETLIPNMQKNMIEGNRDTVNLLVEQILFGSHIILTKVDRIEGDKLKNLIDNIQKINPYSSINSVQFGNLSIDSILKIREYNYFNVQKLIEELEPVLEIEENLDKPYDLATRVLSDERPFHPQRLWDVCHQYLVKKIFRSKGFFWLASRDKQSLLWNQAAGNISLEFIGTWQIGIIEDLNNGLLDEEITLIKEKLNKESGEFGDRRCDLTVIGDKKSVDQFVNQLESCFLTDNEIEYWKNGHQFQDPWPKNLVKIDN